MNVLDLYEQIVKKSSCLCVGLDSELEKFPECLRDVYDVQEAIIRFNIAIINATAPYAIAFKPNLAFYEAYGSQGYLALEHTIIYIRQHYPEIFIIADAKRGDIGNSSRMYAKSIFDSLGADACTVAPYMGSDSVKPFLDFENKWTVLLALTSNKGSNDFQMIKDEAELELYKRVLLTSKEWAGSDKLMYVCGATMAEYFREIRKIVPDNFLLVPGVGSQGGDMEKVFRYGSNRYGGLIINASRSILFASSGEDFAKAAAEEAYKLQQKMEALLIANEVI